MKKIKLSRILDFILWGFIGYLVIQKVIVWNKESKTIGRHFDNKTVSLLTENGLLKKISLFDDQNKKVLIFWATWCGPCKMELFRIQKLIEKNEINPNQILAISVGEDLDTVLKESKIRNYHFPIAIDQTSELANDFNIEATPTIIFTENTKIIDITSGLSLLLEKNIKDFLK